MGGGGGGDKKTKMRIASPESVPTYFLNIPQPVHSSL